MTRSHAIKRLTVSLAETLRITRRATIAIIERPDNSERVRFSRCRYENLMVVPKPDGMIVLCERGETRTVFAGTISTLPGDLDRWSALPETDRAEPADLPVH